MKKRVEITKGQILAGTGKVQLLAVAEMKDGGDTEMANIQITYDWDELDQDKFVIELREKLAEDFDVAPGQVDISESHLLETMRMGFFQARMQGFV
jgi:hypothetical protein